MTSNWLAAVPTTLGRISTLTRPSVTFSISSNQGYMAFWLTWWAAGSQEE
jgi:hypothetical protein